MSGSGVQVGYMNAQRQRVVGCARTRGNPAIRFVVWCSRCGHYYVADDSEIVRRRCPNHDHGAPAISADNRDVEWVTGWPVQSAIRSALM